MNIKQFRYVMVLAEIGNFGKAADALNISQPSLSQYIKNIESQIGIALFDRSGGSVRLTDAGRVYIEAGKKILDLEHQMYSEFADLTEHRKGTVVIGTSPYRSASMMPIVAKEFHQRYPNMQLIVEEMTTDALYDAAEHGEFDFCITMLPIDQRLFYYEKIAEEELILAVPASFSSIPSEIIADRKYPAINASFIDQQPFIMITDNQVMQKALVNLCLDYDLNLQKTVVVKSLEAQIAMVRNGVGMALVPSGIERFCSADEVVFYSFKQNLPKREVVAIWRKDKKFNRATQDLLDIMKNIKW